MKKAKAVKPAYLFGVILLLIARLGLQVLLYRSGFRALTADEFGRMVLAAKWAQEPHIVWHGVWLPFHMYMFGTLLWLKWDLLYVPWATAVFLGLISIVLMYQLASKLFESRKIGLVSAILLAVNPVHTWLSSTPLTEMLNTSLVLASILSITQYLRSKKQLCLYVGAFMWALANGVRYESWMYSIVFSLYLIGEGVLQFWRKNTNIKQSLTFIATAFVPWMFPVVWIIGNYIETGDPLYFATETNLYKLTQYGADSSYNSYLQTFLKIDPYATVLSVVALVACLLSHRKSSAVKWYVAITFIPFFLFAYLHGGQIEPLGNYLRYLAPFIFITYPAVAFLIDLVINLIAKLGAYYTRRQLLTLLLHMIATTQIYTTLHFPNNATTDGLRVGQRIRALRQENPNLSQRPMLVEVSYWQYLAIHVGANDISLLVYDRELDFERFQSPSLLISNLDAVRNCVALYDISYIIVKSPRLRDVVENDLGIPPSEEINNYFFYQVPESIVREYKAAQEPCSLSFGSGY